MAMNNEKMASGSGFKMSPGSKEMDSPHTFREDAPLKQLGMNPMGAAGSPMMDTDNPHYGSRRGKTTAKGLANAKKKSAPASRSKKIGNQKAAAARGKAAKKAGGLSEERKAQLKAEVAKLRAKAGSPTKKTGKGSSGDLKTASGKTIARGTKMEKGKSGYKQKAKVSKSAHAAALAKARANRKKYIK